MARQQLTAKNLAEFEGGKLAAAFDQLLLAAGRDCFDRPGVKNKRSITLTVEVRPELDDAGMCEHVRIEASVGSKTPKYGSREVVGNIQKSGAIIFDDLSPDNPDQSTLEFN